MSLGPNQTSRQVREELCKLVYAQAAFIEAGGIHGRTD